MMTIISEMCEKMLLKYLFSDFYFFYHLWPIDHFYNATVHVRGLRLGPDRQKAEIGTNHVRYKMCKCSPKANTNNLDVKW